MLRIKIKCNILHSAVKPRPGFKTAKFPEPVKKMYDSDSAAMETTTNQYQGSQKPGAEQTQFGR